MTAAGVARPGGPPPDPPPETLPFPTEPAQLPALFRPLRQFVAWRWEHREGQWTKVLLNPRTGQRARANDPLTWGTFAEAVAHARRARLPGISIVLTEKLGIVGGDIDHCRARETGELSALAEGIRSRLDTATWVSTTGTGLRWFVRARFPEWFVASMTGKKTGRRDTARGIEVYSTGRHLTLTTVRVPGTSEEIESRQAELDALLLELFPPKPAAAPTGPAWGGDAAGATGFDDAEVLRRCESGKHADRFRRLFLYGDASEYPGPDGRPNLSSADLGLCNLLRYYSGDRAQVERLWGRSALAQRSKWQRADYRARTLDEAMVGDVYTPPLTIDLGGVGGRTNGAVAAAESPPPEPPAGDDGDDDGGGDEPPSLAPGVDGFALTDLGNAERLLAAHGEHLRYCAMWGKWLAWDGTRWVVDADETHARAFARRVIRKMSRDAQRRIPVDKKGALRLFKWAVKCETASRAPAMLAHARTFARVWVTADQLDADDYLLNCANGTIDLRTGGLRRHDPADLLTQQAPVAFDPDAACPVWEQSLGEIFCEDAELVAFVQRLVGVSITGDVKDHLFPVAWGSTGRNGKGLLLETLVAALGDYGATLPADELMATRNERHPTGLATLYRKRLVVASETEGGRRLAVARVKELSGGNPITARRMREDFWTFRATHTVWLVTNDKPEIRETKDAIWDRVKLLPFRVYFRDPARPDERPRGAPERILDKDPDRYRKVARELPGILAWAVRGCLAWQREGLREPQIVVAATDTYRDEQDVLARFLEDRCELGAQLKAEATPLYLAYRGWCERVGERPESQTRFGERLSERGHPAEKDPTTRLMVRLGLRLVPLPDEAAPPPSEAPP